MIKRIFLVLLFLQASFAMDSSIEAALRCIEKKKMDVHAVEKIDGKVYARGRFYPADEETCDIISSVAPVFEIKKNCNFEKKDWFKKIEDIEPQRLLSIGRKGLLVALQNNSGDSISVIEKNKVLWSCPLEKDGNAAFQFLDKNRLMVSIKDRRNGDSASIELLDNKCQWTLLEKKASLLSIDKNTSDSRFLYYAIKHKPYIIFYDSLYNKHWGTSSSFKFNVSTRDIACGITDYITDDETNNSKKMIKCIKWTGGYFVEEILPHKIDIPNSNRCLCACRTAERLLPCGEGICVQNYKTKKIEILVK